MHIWHQDNSLSPPPICLSLLKLFNLLLEMPLSSGLCEGYSFLTISSLKRSALRLRLLLRLGVLIEGLALRARRSFCCRTRSCSAPKDFDRFGGCFRSPSKPKDFDRFGGLLPLRCKSDDFDLFGGFLSGLPERPRLRERALSLESSRDGLRPLLMLLFTGSFWLNDRPRERALSLDSSRDGRRASAVWLLDLTRFTILVGLRLFGVPLDSIVELVLLCMVCSHNTDLCRIPCIPR